MSDTITPAIDPDAVRRATLAMQRQIYGLGDYGWLARRLEPAATELVARASVTRGDRVLDVATGDGSVALAAAGLGATVTALDLSPEQLDLGEARARAEGREVTWVEGDAQAMPFGDGEFDAVLSSLGAIYAPGAAATAGELARVCASGGRIALTAWPEHSFNERLGGVIAPYVPEDGLPLAEGAWATPDAIDELLAPHVTGLEIEAFTFAMEFASMREFWDGLSSNVPIQQVLAQMVGPEAYEAIGRDTVRLAHEFNRAVDGTVAIEMEVLVAVGRRV